MKDKHRLLAKMGIVLLAAAIARDATMYQRWKQAEMQRLRSDSTMLETPFGPLEYHMSGSGPAILVAHGSPGGYDLGLALQNLIGRTDFTYISISRPGYLRTPLSTGKTPEEQADLYASVLDLLGIQQASIIGISGGGPSAIQFVLRHPEHCSSLVLISAVAQQYSESIRNPSLSPFRRSVQTIIGKLTTSDPLLYEILKIVRLPLPGIDSALFELLRTTIFYEKRQIGYENDMRQFAAITQYPLEHIAVPTLVVHGTADHEVPFEHAELVQRNVPGVRLFVIPRGGHTAFFTHAATVMPHLRSFLQQAASHEQ